MEISIVWFRKCLRVHDNVPLFKAASNSLKILPIFILDPNFKQFNIGKNRWRFLFESLEDLDANLKAKGSRLFIFRGTPQEVFSRLFKEFEVKNLYYEKDSEPYSKLRDAQIDSLCNSNKISVFKYSGHTLYDLDQLYDFAHQLVPKNYNAFQEILRKFGEPNQPFNEPKTLNSLMIENFKQKIDDLKLISLDQHGVDLSGIEATKFPGGESEALRRMKMTLENENWVRKFEKPKTAPNSIEPSTTVLSPYLKFGCLSPRVFFFKLKEICSKQSNHTKPPVSLIGQLYWREFFYYVAAFTPNFDKIEGNQICKQIVWDNNPEFLERWKLGETGFPYIDAIMRQLRKEGWIHHLARHSVACFLTRGHLYQSWREGAKVFDEYLLDADWSLNNANWMWLSCSSFFYQYFRIYSPVGFGKPTDPNGAYIRKYVPILKDFPKEFIYEPWKAPLDVQKKCKCIIGKDYPKPMVDQDAAKKYCLEQMKKYFDEAKRDSQTPEKVNLKRKSYQ